MVKIRLFVNDSIFENPIRTGLHWIGPHGLEIIYCHIKRIRINSRLTFSLKRLKVCKYNF
jgi:hypothetical protein